jgi:hypothetical protein
MIDILKDWSSNNNAKQNLEEIMEHVWLSNMVILILLVLCCRLTPSHTRIQESHVVLRKLQA